MRAMPKKKILYAGDSPAGGPANYLLAILNTLPVEYIHVPPGEPLKSSLSKTAFDAFIFSDYSHRDLSRKVEKDIARSVDKGAGLLMIGGWGSFAGPFGGWAGSLIEERLPVQCLRRDDRVNLSSGLLIQKKQPHPILEKSNLESSPVICGFNEVQVKRSSETLLVLKAMQNQNGQVKLLQKEYPFLVVSGSAAERRAALTTDLAPHWCGGWVDWGKKHRKLAVNSKIAVEVGDAYILFVQQLLRWTAGI